jgi:hypothetical protein
MKTILFIIFTVFLCASFVPKKKRGLTFTPTFQRNIIQLDRDYYRYEDTIRFSSLKFYISNIKLHKGKSKTYCFPKQFHLIDLSSPASLRILSQKVKKSNWDSVSFTLGIDSITNSAGALGGDLDPTNGMYWTWQSGYINTKIEGFSSQCPTRKNKFQFHLGGFTFPHQTAQKATLPYAEDGEYELNFSKLFSTINLESNHTIMSPGKKAVDMTEILATCFHSKL